MFALPTSRLVSLEGGVTVQRVGEVVITRFADGKDITATRHYDRDNRAEAVDQGYADTPEGVAQSLLDHEVLHTLIGRVLRQNGGESCVLRHECGAEKHRYAVRLFEEAVVISFQRWLNTGEMDNAVNTLTWAEREMVKARLMEARSCF